MRGHFVSCFLREDWNDKEKLIQLKKLIGHTSDDIHKDVTITHYDREEIELSRAKTLIDTIEFNIDDGYKVIQELLFKNYNEVVIDIDL